MIIDIDLTSPVPAFEQVRSQLADMIVAGQLAAGDRLPPIRQLAADLELAPGTVARVYRELEQAGLVRSRVRHGTVVASGQQASAAEMDDQLAQAARAYALTARRLGVNLTESVAALRAGWGALQ